MGSANTEQPTSGKTEACASLGAMKQIFISYARADDEAFVRELYGDLERAGLSTWFDREAMESRGRTFLQELRDAIADDRLDRLVLVVGPKAAASEVVKAEWG